LKKFLFTASMVLIASLVGACSQSPAECPTCPPTPEPETIVQEVTVEVPAVCPVIECPTCECPTVQCPECPAGLADLGPWTVLQSIDTNGQYLMPEEMEPGQWAYQADDPSDICWANTFSDLSGSDDSKLDSFYSENKGFFVLNENVRMVELKFGPCTWSRIGE